MIDADHRCGEQEVYNCGLRHPAARVVLEVGGVVVGIGDREQIVFGVVVVGGDVIGRIGHRGQPVVVVVGVGRGLLVLVGHRRAPPARTVAEADGAAIGIRNPGRSSCLLLLFQLRDHAKIFQRGHIALHVAVCGQFAQKTPHNFPAAGLGE